MTHQYALAVDLARTARDALTDEMIDAECWHLFRPSGDNRRHYLHALVAWHEADDRLSQAKAALWRYEHGVIGPWAPRATIGVSDFNRATGGGHD